MAKTINITSKTAEEEFLEDYEIFEDKINLISLYIRHKSTRTIYVLKDDFNSDSLKFEIEEFPWNTNPSDRKLYLQIKSIIDGTNLDKDSHKIVELKYQDLPPNYPYEICETIKKINDE